MTKGTLGFLLTSMLTFLVACGEVVTPQPTVPVTPTATPPPVYTPTRRPTATAPFTPPPPTATPTVTPTPITHLVKSGETLLSIAFDYGVSLQALQTINGIEDARFLQVGQELIIPTGEEEPGAAPSLLLPTPTPLPFSLRGVSFYETPVGSLWCLGEIVNTTEFVLANVQVRVTLFDAAGESLAEADAFAAAEIIPPGERSPFGILFTDPPSDWANPQVAILRGQEAAALADAYVPIAVTDVEAQPSEARFRASGTVRNTSEEQVAGRVSVIVTTYDAEGAVTGFRQGTAGGGEPLAPGATAPFSLLITYHGNAPKDFSVIAVGRVPTE